MKNNEIKIYKTKLSVILLFLLLMLFTLFMCGIHILNLKYYITEGGGYLSSYIESMLFILLPIPFIHIFIYFITKKIIISSDGIKSIEIPISPIIPLSSNKILLELKWSDIEALKMKKVPFNKENQYFLISENKNFIFFHELENTIQLINYIENMTEKKFSKIGYFEKI